MNKVKLGKGLNALIPSDLDVSDRHKLVYLETDRLHTNPHQPRHSFDTEALKKLADSIRDNGILQPLIVQVSDDDFQIIAGERRFRAAKMIGLEKVPAILVERLSKMEQMKLALIENLQREDLNDIELAEGYSRMIEEFGLTQEKLAEAVSRERSTIANTLRLLNLPDEIKEMIREGRLSGGHARTILALEDEQKQLELARRIIDEKLSVRAIESIIYGDKKRKKRGRSLKLKRIPPEIIEAETELKRYLGTKVELKPGLKKGRIEIEFYSDSDLTRILELILNR